MTKKELERLAIVRRVQKRGLKQKVAAERLWKRGKIKVSDEKMRWIMIGAGLWRARRHKTVRHPCLDTPKIVIDNIHETDLISMR